MTDIVSWSFFVLVVVGGGCLIALDIRRNPAQGDEYVGLIPGVILMLILAFLFGFPV